MSQQQVRCCSRLSSTAMKPTPSAAKYRIDAE